MKWTGGLYIFAAGILWGTIGAFINLMNAYGCGAMMTGFLRVFFAGLIMLAASILKYGVQALRISKKSLLSCAALGVICHGIYNIFYNLAVARSGMAVSAILLNIAPVFTALFSFFLFNEALTKKKILALFINVIGCSLAAAGAPNASELSATGILCGAAAGFCYAMTAIIGRLAGKAENAYVISTYSFLFASLFLIFPLMGSGELHSISGRAAAVGFLYALIPTSIGYVLYYQGLQKIREISKAPVIASVECIAAVWIGVSFFGESMNVIKIAGICVVFCSIFMMKSL